MIRGASGREYIDFFSAAGSLNFGHSHPEIIGPVVRFLSSGGVVNTLDMLTPVRGQFLTRLNAYAMEPMGDYVVQFCGPTGTNAVEAALRLARKVTGRSEIAAFAGGYHGNTMGSLQVTSNRFYRQQSGGAARFLSYSREAVDRERRDLRDDHAGIQPPAAYLVETTQAEGGVNVGSPEFLGALAALAREVGALLIVDDIQVGCHRVGPFLSVGGLGITPDVVLLSKSLSGFGTPFSVLLIKREHDQWVPGEHTGTFRGNQLGMVGAVAAMELAERLALPRRVAEMGAKLNAALCAVAEAAPGEVTVRGTGMIWGLDFTASGDESLATTVQRECFSRGLMLEVCGRGSQVIKLLPALTIPDHLLEQGIEILASAVRAAAHRAART